MMVKSGHFSDQMYSSDIVTKTSSKMANREFNGYIRHSHHGPSTSKSFQVKRLDLTTPKFF